jgi:YHS domain-containing protein
MTEAEQREAEAQEAEAVDPICGSAVRPDDRGAASLRHAGRTWRFCGPACRALFARRAERAVLAEALRAGRLLSHRGRVRWGAA